MAEDLHKDNLEDLFKDIFDEQSDAPSNEGWDMPSDKVWDTIDQAIRQEDDDAVPVWFRYWWIGAIALILVGSGIFYAYSKKGSPEVKEISIDASSTAEADQNISGASNDIFSKENINPNLSNTESSTTEEATDDDNTLQNNTNPDEPINQKDPAFISSNSTKDAPQLAPNPNTSKSKSLANKNLDFNSSNNEGIGGLPDVVVKKDNNLVTDSSTSTPTVNDNLENQNTVSEKSDMKNDLVLPFREVEFLAPISTEILFALASDHTDEKMPLLDKPFTNLDKLDSKAPPKSGFYAGVLLAPTNSYRVIKSIRTPSLPIDLDRFERSQYSFATGLNLGLKISENWSIESGFIYSKYSLEHKRRRQVRYSMADEVQNDAGRFEKDYQIDIETSSGDISADFALSRSSDIAIPENDFIALEVKGKQNITYGSIPIIARYRVGKKKWQIGLKAGVINRFVLEGTFNIESVNVRRSGVELVLNDRVYRQRELKNIKKYQADYLLGFGINYHLTDKIWFYAEPSISRSINPLFKNQNFKSFPTTRSLDFGVNYLF